jgi:nicotinate-nucleotide--dimethylbenzimidazole phosphoribosyltransferase
MNNFKNLAIISEMLKGMPIKDSEAEAKAIAHQNQLTKPPRALGVLEDLAVFLASWQGKTMPSLETAQAIVFAGNHGVCAQGVNPFPQDVTMQMVKNFKAGGAAINQICEVSGADLTVIPLSLETPTADFTRDEAMSEIELCEAMETGFQSVNLDADIILLGEMGIGNSTISSALATSVFGGSVESWVGAGTGSDQKGQAHKAAIIELGIKKHGSQKGLKALQTFGGREQAAICGAILAARSASIPVLLDGFICTAAAAPLFGASRSSLDHCLFGHLSTEPGHKFLLEAMGKSAILNLNMRLGEGTGAALALSIIRSAVACHNNMATFESAGVSNK